ncbi:DnaQ-like DNA polymerase III subunit [Mycobacterium phage IdentityCrisis]|uniref:Exonuclease n=1 Tax=Mycobacterium phage IdentityCrisis TaxID=2599866 RepID=A0A5J6TJE0_9CAUD|nr:DnaQ-like DNA polymerase III subunit [Mycobacterium phage IdentityCrisis]QFG10077.1 DnaQ-like DNA polymerase III subunit [Mycobacterium phage IdentityCrisis]
MTIYCYDTEFLEDGHTIELISIGIVCEDGREYYAVNADMPYERLKKEEWLCENVIPHLPLTGNPPTVEQHTNPSSGYYWSLDTKSVLVKPKWVIANEVREFLLAAPDPELWAYYAAYDHVALAQLWGPMINLPEGIPMYTHDLKQEMDRVGVDSGEFPSPAAAHNALADAQWNWSVLSEIRQRQLWAEQRGNSEGVRNA